MKVPELNVFKDLHTIKKKSRFASPQYQNRRKDLADCLFQERTLLTVKSTKLITDNYINKMKFYEMDHIKSYTNPSPLLTKRQNYHDEYLYRTLNKLNAYNQNTYNLYSCTQCNPYLLDNICIHNLYNTQRNVKNSQNMKQSKRKTKKQQQNNTLKLLKFKSKRSLDNFQDKIIASAFKEMLVFYNIKNLNEDQMQQMRLLLQQVSRMDLKFKQKKQILLAKLKEWKQINLSPVSPLNNILEQKIENNDFTDKIDKLFNKIENYQFDMFNKLKENDELVSLSSLIRLKDQNLKMNRDYVDKLDELIKKVQKHEKEGILINQLSFFK